MPMHFDRMGLWFKLFSRGFYTRSARRRLSVFLAPVTTGQIVVDLGGGAGALLQLAHRRRADVVFMCLDPSMGMLRYTPSYAFRVQARAENLPLIRQSVAAVLIGDALHHFDNPDRAVKEISRCLQMAGRLFIFDINPRHPLGRAIAFLERFLGEPTKFYTPEQLGDLLAMNGFRVLSITHSFRYTIEAELQ